MVDKSGVQHVIAKVVGVASIAAHEQLATSPEAQQVGLWLADDEDTEGISKPAASLLARAGLSANLGAEGNDILALATALLGYAAKQFSRALAAKSLRKQRLQQEQAAQAAVTIPGELL